MAVCSTTVWWRPGAKQLRLLKLDRDILMAVYFLTCQQVDVVTWRSLGAGVLPGVWASPLPASTS